MGNYKQGHLKKFTKTGSLQLRMNLSINNTNSTMWGYIDKLQGRMDLFHRTLELIHEYHMFSLKGHLMCMENRAIFMTMS